MWKSSSKFETSMSSFLVISTKRSVKSKNIKMSPYLTPVHKMDNFLRGHLAFSDQPQKWPIAVNKFCWFSSARQTTKLDEQGPWQIYSQLSRWSTARGSSTGLFHVGPTNVKACKPFLFTKGSHKVWNKILCYKCVAFLGDFRMSKMFR